MVRETTNSGFMSYDMETTKDASVAREKVQDLAERVKTIEDAVLKTEGRLAAIETDIAYLKKSNSEILQKIGEVSSRMDKQEGFFDGVKLTAKASGWVIGLIYSIVGGALGFLLHYLRK